MNSSIKIISANNTEPVQAELDKIGVDPAALKSLREKTNFYLISITDIDNRAANILKQQLLSLGGEAAISREVANFKLGKSTALLMATLYQLNKLIPKLKKQPFGLKQIASRIKQIIQQHKEK